MTNTTPKAAFTLLVGTAAIDKAITSIQTRGKRLDMDIWKAAVSAMAHHAEHGDVTLVNRLVAAMPKGSRVNALRDFIAAHGKLTYCGEAKEFLHDREGNFDLDGALAKSWVEYKPEQEYTVIDAKSLLLNLLKQATRETKGKTTNKLTVAERKRIAEFCGEFGVTAG